MARQIRRAISEKEKLAEKQTKGWKTVLGCLGYGIVAVGFGLYVLVSEKGPAGTVVMVFGAAGFLMSFVIANSLLRNTPIHIRCPHCEENINVFRKWECGWCGHKEKLLGDSDPLPVERCGNKDCEQKQNAMRCPHCTQDVIFDEVAHRSAPMHGVMRAGVALVEKDKPASESNPDSPRPNSQFDKDIS